MFKIQNFIYILIPLFIIGFISGCYTIINHSPELEERYIYNPEYDDAYVYYDSDGYYYYEDDYPFSSFWGYYDLYYGFINPYSYYYWDYPRWYYDDYYYQGKPSYVPEKKPENKYRGADIRSNINRGTENITPSDSKKEEEKTNREVQRPKSSRSTIERAPRNVKESKSEDEEN